MLSNRDVFIVWRPEAGGVLALKHKDVGGVSALYKCLSFRRSRDTAAGSSSGHQFSGLVFNFKPHLF